MLTCYLPVGYRPFVEACVDAGEKEQALKYIPKLADPRERAEVMEAILFNCRRFLCQYPSIVTMSSL